MQHRQEYGSRRKYPRRMTTEVNLNGQLDFAGTGRQLYFRLVNISDGGAQLWTPSENISGHEANFSLDLFLADTNGYVVWTKPCPEKGGLNVGFKFHHPVKARKLAERVVQMVDEFVV